MMQRFRRLPIFSLLGLALLAAPARATDSWVEVRSPHFTVASNSGEKEARRVANQFEEMRAVFQVNFSSLRVDPGEPLVIRGQERRLVEAAPA